jgi:hypothetical protein
MGEGAREHSAPEQRLARVPVGAALKIRAPPPIGVSPCGILLFLNAS